MYLKFYHVPTLVSTDIVNDASCNGLSDGSATASAVNGISGTDSVSLHYAWSNGQTTSIATGLAAESHYCVVTDSVNMCSDTSYVAISEPSAISASIITQDATNPTTANGTATANIGGGTVFYVRHYCSWHTRI